MSLTFSKPVSQTPLNDLRNAGTGRLPGLWLPLLNDCVLLTVLVYLPALGNLCMLFDVLDYLCPDLPCTLTPFCSVCSLSLEEMLVESAYGPEVPRNRAVFHRAAV